MVETVIVPIVLALLTTLVAVYAARKQDKRLAEKQDTDRAAALNDMALELIEPYKNAVAELRQKVHDLECELIKERDKRRELEEVVKLKDERIVELEAEVIKLRSEVEALQRKRRL